MKRFRERNQARTGAITIGVVIGLIALALNFGKLPFVNNNATYHADFVDAGDLVTGDIVTVAGVHQGRITDIALHGNRVRVTFQVNSGLHLGIDTGAHAKVLTPIGQEYIELTPAGPGHLTSSSVIPTARTSIPSTLVGDLNTLGAETGKYNTSQLAKALEATGQTFGAVPAATTVRALSGLARFSQILADREGELQTLVSSGASVTGVLNQRSGELVTLVGQGDLVLKVLNARRSAVKQLLATTTALSSDLDAILVGDRSQITTLLTNLQTVSGVLSKDSTSLSDAIPVLAAFDRYAANAGGSGAFVDTVIPTTLIPDNIVSQCGHQDLSNPILGCHA
jgi:phospholipid/cholesterol/gamma-HCH transport system substrate-binding protein